MYRVSFFNTTLTKKRGDKIALIAAPLLNNHTKQILEIHHRLEDELARASAIGV